MAKDQMKHDPDHIYPEEIRQYEKEIIQFVIESGKDKRSSEVESHILAYFFLHPQLTQAGIQKLSSLFREKEISLGSISKFLNQYEKYQILEKTIHPQKKNTFVYAITQQTMTTLTSSGFSAGKNQLRQWIQDFELYYKAISQLDNKLDNKRVKILTAKIREIRDFYLFHYQLMDFFLEGEIKLPNSQDLNINKLDFEIDIPDNDVKKIQLRAEQNLEDIEREIVGLLSSSQLFFLDQVKYIPIYCQLLLRDRMTQHELRNATELSSGTISEGIRYLVEKNYARLAKIEGIRKRFYCVPSIGYSNYLKQYRRFIRIQKMKIRLERIQDEMVSREGKFKSLPGYDYVLHWVKEFLGQYKYVDRGLKIFSLALQYFNTSKEINASIQI